MGYILRVNLEKKKSNVEVLEESTARNFIGGRGLGLKILFDEVEPDIEPLGPSNKLLFLTGPIAGTMFPGSSRYCVMAKSPLTGCQGEAHAGGSFAFRMKKAGFDSIIIEGSSETPVYLWIHDKRAEIVEAEDLWGLTTHRTELAVKEEINDQKASVASIGPGGEKLVRFACIINDRSAAAGRTGMGAVMGSKKLKAIAVSGEQEIKVADKKKLGDLSRIILKRLFADKSVKNFIKHGTPYGTPILNETGGLPTRNFSKGYFAEAEKIGGEAMTNTILKNTEGCHICPLRCGRLVAVKSGPYQGDFEDGPEYEAVASLGSLCLNSSLESISYGNHLCNLNSMDVISTGSCIAFAMECYEKGLLSKKDTGNIELIWGNSKSIIQMIEKIAKREGLGDVLADGVRIASEKIPGSRKFALHVKGLEIPMHEPRGKPGLALSYATANRGAVHTDAAHDTAWEGNRQMKEIDLYGPIDRFELKGKPNLIRKVRDIRSIQNSLIVCSYVGNPSYRPVSVQELVDLLNYVTGLDLTLAEVITMGERITNVGRAFNVREGIRRDDDHLPERFQDPLPDGYCKGQNVSEENLDRMLDELYQLSGWDLKTGIPTQEKLKELGLDFVLEQFRNMNIY